MKAVMTITIVVFLVIGLGAMPAIADPCEFIAGSGIWGSAGNWTDCGGDYPRAGDTAIIAGTCRVESADQAADAITVSGTLEIKGHDLTLCSGGAARTRPSFTERSSS